MTIQVEAQTSQLPDVGPNTQLYVEAWKVYADGEYDHALELATHGLDADRRAGAARGVAEALNLIGTVRYKQGDYSLAQQTYLEAEKAARESGYDFGLARDWSSLGSTYYRTGKFALAKQYYEKSLDLRRKLRSDDSELARALNDIANVYQQLGNYSRSLSIRRQALILFHHATDQAGVADVLNDIAWTYDDMGREVEARRCIQQSLDLSQRLNMRVSTLDNLEGLGLLDAKLGKYDLALTSLNEALAGYKSLHQEDEVSQVLNDVGQVYLQQGKNEEALSRFEEATRVEAFVGNQPVEVVTFAGLMRCWRSLDRPLPAVFFGKQAVNIIQQERRSIQELGIDLQRSFLTPKEGVYRELAGLLIDQGRLPEAQQVLDLLKQHEYSDYVRGGPTNMLSPLTLSPEEIQAEDDYQKSTAQLVSLGEQWAQLKKNTTRTSEQEQQYQQLFADLDQASKSLNDYYSRLFVIFGGNYGDANRRVADVEGNVSLLKQQIVKMPNTVALYTMVTRDRYRVIVITRSTTVAREYTVSEKDLNQEVAAFQRILRTPSQNPKPLAQELYKILVGPIRQDLEQAHVQTLVWSLDGVLRYLPMAALYDGKQYVVENYSTVVITPTSIPHLSEKPDVSNMSAVAMGISRKYEDNLPALPTVVSELDEIVKDPLVKETQGVLPGKILLDGSFTETAMENQLGNEPTIVHIASHFVFKPGDDNQSYLLLAGKDKDDAGYHLTVADFRDNQKLTLDETELLTLSACETGMSGNAGNGREVDGLGTTAQLKGAKAVISSLWEVNDASTGQLMADFYQRWVSGAGKVEKVEALRQAQLDLLLGKVTPEAGVAGRGFSVEGAASQAPKGYAHPYYWAPFVLMGNWR
jgi:CHAT domain-containing protein/Flp pilus assembly protein TadD